MHIRLRALGGPLVLLLWQAAPVTTVQDSLGRTRVTISYGTGRYDDILYSCDGDVESDDRISYQTGGIRLDRWLSNTLRLTGFGGRRTHTLVPFKGRPSGAPAPGPDNYYGAELAWESRGVGLGFGVARSAQIDSGAVMPSLYLRFGDIDNVHFRTDLYPPSETHGSTGLWRAGLERNAGQLRGVSWFTGLAACHFCRANSDTGVFGELSVPLDRYVDLVGRGLLSSVKGNTGGSFALGARVNF